MKKIQDFIEMNKEILFISTAIILVGLVGFGLGRLSARYQTAGLDIKSTLVNATDLNKIIASSPSNNNSSTVKTNNNNAVTANVSNVVEPTGDGEVAIQKVVGNKTSKIYHLENCSGALKMKEENKIYFASAAEAGSAGYKPAGNCPGLK